MCCCVLSRSLSGQGWLLRVWVFWSFVYHWSLYSSVCVTPLAATPPDAAASLPEPVCLCHRLLRGRLRLPLASPRVSKVRGQPVWEAIHHIVLLVWARSQRQSGPGECCRINLSMFLAHWHIFQQDTAAMADAASRQIMNALGGVEVSISQQV